MYEEQDEHIGQKGGMGASNYVNDSNRVWFVVGAVTSSWHMHTSDIRQIDKWLQLLIVVYSDLGFKWLTWHEWPSCEFKVKLIAYYST